MNRNISPYAKSPTQQTRSEQQRCHLDNSHSHEEDNTNHPTIHYSNAITPRKLQSLLHYSVSIASFEKACSDLSSKLHTSMMFLFQFAHAITDCRQTNPCPQIQQSSPSTSPFARSQYTIRQLNITSLDIAPPTDQQSTNRPPSTTPHHQKTKNFLKP